MTSTNSTTSRPAESIDRLTKLLVEQPQRQDAAVRQADKESELPKLISRYVTPDRRYLKLGGNLLRIE
ncbi:hypothetical protein [Streptomyces sp. NPDC002078]